MEFRIDTGSGGVDIEVAGRDRARNDGVWTVKMGEGAGRGVIDTGSGSVRISVP